MKRRKKRRDRMKLLKCRKGLSPVVAAIILIAVTVAVSIAVAAWMGSLTVGFMETEELDIIGVTYDEDAKKVSIEVANVGTNTIAITSIRIDDVTYKNFNSTGNGELVTDTLPYDLDKGHINTFEITFTNWPFNSGVKYGFTVLTARGNPFGPFTKTAPS